MHARPSCMATATGDMNRPAGLVLILTFALMLGTYACRSVSTSAIEVGERREAVLRERGSGRRELGRGPEARWSFHGRGGQKVSIKAESYEFDVCMALLDPQGKRIAFADDNGGFSNAQIDTTIDSEGAFTVVVGGVDEDQFGNYSVAVYEGDHPVDWSRSAIEAYYKHGIEWAEQHDNNRAKSWLNLGLGHYLAERRNWDEAERYYVESFSQADQGRFYYGKWAAALQRGALFARRRRFDQALSEFQSALETSKSLRASDEAESRVLIEFGNLYQAIARPDLSRIYFRAATAQAEQHGSRSTLVSLYTSLSTLLQSQDKEKAISYAESAYGLREGLAPALELKALYTLAGTYLFLDPGRSKEGMALAEQMRDKARQAGCLDEEVGSLALISMARYAAGDVPAMIDSARQSLELTPAEDENPNNKRIALQLLAEGEKARGDNSAALSWCLRALDTVETAWAKERIEELRRELLSQSRAICTQIIGNLDAMNRSHPRMEFARQAFDYAERSRSRSLLEQLPGADTTRKAQDTELLNRERELLDQISAVRGQLVMLESSSSRETLYKLQERRAGLIAERIRLQAEISDSIGSRYRAAHLSPVTAEQAQNILAEFGPNSAVLYYQLGIQASFVVAVTPKGFYLYRLPDWTIISKAVTEWRVRISEQSGRQPDAASAEAYDRIAHNLYSLLVGPAAGVIQGRDLIIVPSDALSGLAFEALVVRDAKVERGAKYLVEQRAVSYVPSISVLAELVSKKREGGARSKGLLLLGDVSSAPDSVGDLALRGTLNESLPAAREEIEEIGRMAVARGLSPTIWLGAEASEKKFKITDLSGFRFVHIATHGISDKQDGESSALALATGPDESEDGILTSAEIETLKLNAELVVLSGCETSIGQAAGAEGMVGLSRTFLVAGARSVCGSLWRVEDVWTEKLMTEFYRGFLGNGRNKAQALRLAKLAMLKNGANPSQWAPFILVGVPA